jgi:putative FmdB family regulatory protein
MPIYAYRCETCGFTKDVLQKISDPVLTDCLSCSKPTFKKQVTAAGFQLKGTGWYATDFRGGNNKPGTSKAESGGTDEADGAASTASADAGSTDSGKSSDSPPATASASNTPPTAPSDNS